MRASKRFLRRLLRAGGLTSGKWLVTRWTALYCGGEAGRYICKQVAKSFLARLLCLQENKREWCVGAQLRRRGERPLQSGWPGKAPWRRRLLSWGLTSVTTASRQRGEQVPGVWREEAWHVWEPERRQGPRGEPGRGWSREASRCCHYDSSNHSKNSGFHTLYHGNPLGRTWNETG